MANSGEHRRLARFAHPGSHFPIALPAEAGEWSAPESGSQAFLHPPLHRDLFRRIGAGWTSTPAQQAALCSQPYQASRLDKSRLWMVERTLDHETFSNGLRIDTRYAISHHRRSYLLFTGDRQQRFSTPAGIVYHSTESHLAPFGPEYNDILRETAEELTSYIQRHRAYNYVIDRFGRVFRVVEEADSADHAGNSAWAWNGSLCLNLNHAFLGVAFEARTKSPSVRRSSTPAGS